MNDHTRVSDTLKVILRRLPLGALKKLSEADELVWHASMNLGLSAQIEAQQRFDRLVEELVSTIGDLETVVAHMDLIDTTTHQCQEAD